MSTPPPPSGCLPGLANLGNTCYVNATLQCLATSATLRARLAELCDARRALVLSTQGWPGDRGGGTSHGGGNPHAELPTPSLAEAALPLLALPSSGLADRSEPRGVHSASPSLSVS